MNARRFAALAVAGFLLLQGIWILTVPPFRGIDEFDHAFRAAGAATGQWQLTEPAVDGRGMEVVVPADLVEAASAQCDWLPYPGPDNCFPIERLSGERVRIATSAALYNPLWYAVIGQAGRSFEGAGSLYAMRIATSLICALGVGVASWALALARPGRWTRLAFVASMTPVLVYSTVVPGPNGLEIAAGLTLWTCLLSVFSSEVPSRYDVALVLLAASAGSVLATLRLLGPLWLGMVVLSVVAVVGSRKAMQEVAGRPGLWGLSAVAVTLAVAAGAWWSLDQGMTETAIDVQGKEPMPDFEVGTKPIAWTLGMIAAFPLRRDTAHPAVYLCVTLVLGFLLYSAVARSRGRLRIVLVTCVAIVVILPLILTLLTMDVQGVIWQGRYQLAWAVGIPVVAGLQLDRVKFLHREGARPMIVAVILLAVAHTLSVWGVAHDELTRPVSADDPHWMTLPPTVLGLTCLVGFLAWGGAMSTWKHSAGNAESQRPRIMMRSARSEE